jgi:uncharacterized protein YjbI with pentapeptide repeats
LFKALVLSNKINLTNIGIIEVSDISSEERNLSGADPSDANLENANLSHANLSNACLMDINLK